MTYKRHVIKIGRTEYLAELDQLFPDSITLLLHKNMVTLRGAAVITETGHTIPEYVSKANRPKFEIAVTVLRARGLIAPWFAAPVTDGTPP